MGFRVFMAHSSTNSSVITIGVMLIKKFIDDRCTILAAALSFTTMLSIVPFLALVFAILKKFEVDTAVTPLLLSNLTAGSQEVAMRIMRYIHNTHVGSLGFMGFVLLLVSVLAALDTVENAFNQICRIEKGKAAHHKLRDYLIVIVCIPLCIAMAVTLATTLQHQGFVQWLLQHMGTGKLTLLKLLPFVSISIALSSLYFFIPNHVVRMRYAFVSGVAASLLLQISQWGYIHLQVGVSRYNAIYGTLALLPVFMVWIYTSWVIVLIGMELAWYMGFREKWKKSEKAVIH